MAKKTFFFLKSPLVAVHTDFVMQSTRDKFRKYNYLIFNFIYFDVICKISLNNINTNLEILPYLGTRTLIRIFLLDFLFPS